MTHKARIIPLLLAAILSSADVVAFSPEDRARLLNTKIPFQVNTGQLDAAVKLYADTFAGRVFVTRDGVTYAFIATDSGVAVKERFLGKDLEPSGVRRSPTVINSFKGGSDQWRTNMPTYEGVSLGKLWYNIDVELRATGSNVEKIFTVKRGGDPADIRMQITGSTPLKVSDKGELLLTTAKGVVTMTKPVAYQEINGGRQTVDAAYEVDQVSYGFKIGDYDKRHSLVIDPLLGSTYLGGSNSEIFSSAHQMQIAVDLDGEILVFAQTRSTDYPTTPGAFDTEKPGFSNDDCVISKFDAQLKTLLASTFLGGSLTEQSKGMALDANGDVYVACFTGSGDYPITAGAFDTDLNLTDTAISKLSNDLTTLHASTFLGGAGGDRPHGLAIDPDGNVMVMGITNSAADFPIQPGAYDPTYNGGNDDVFLVKLNPNLTTVLAGTFLGGGGNDFARGIALDAAGNAYLFGDTQSFDWPITPGTVPALSGDYLAYLSNDLTTLIASTFIGPVARDARIQSVDVATNGNVLVSGYTDATNFSATAGGYDSTHNGFGDAYIARLDSGLTTYLAATFLGGAYFESAVGVIEAANGDIFVTGTTGSADFPTTPDAFTPNVTLGPSNVYTSRFNSSLTSLLASTFIGDTDSTDIAMTAALSATGDLYVGGQVNSSDFPTNSASFNQENNGGADLFLFGITPDMKAFDPDVDGIDDSYFDNCPGVFNPSQELTACQPTITIVSAIDDGQLLTVDAEATDPNGDPLTGEVVIKQGNRELVIFDFNGWTDIIDTDASVQRPSITNGAYTGTNVEFSCNSCDVATFADAVTQIGGSGPSFCGYSAQIPRNIVVNDDKLCARSTVSGFRKDIDFLSHRSSRGCVDIDGVSCQTAGYFSSYIKGKETVLHTESWISSPPSAIDVSGLGLQANGIYTLVVTASDGIVAAASATIEFLHSGSSSDQLLNTIDLVISFDLSNGLTNSLVSKLEAAIASLERGNSNSASNQIQAFINQVEAQRGKGLSDEQADRLIDAVAAI